MIYLIEFIIIQKLVTIFSKVLNRATESKVQNRDIYTSSLKIGTDENREFREIPTIFQPKNFKNFDDFQSKNFTR